MNRFIALLIILTCFTLQLQAQFRYTFRSTPDSIPVLMNGKQECTTPCAVNFYWKDAEDGKILFELKKPGFEEWKDSLISKPSKFNFYVNEVLKRRLPVYDINKTSPPIAFDKLVANFKDGKEIGSNIDRSGNKTTIKWDGTTKIGESAFEERFYEIINNAGFNSPMSESAELFSKGNDKSLPRYMVGAQLVDYQVNISYDEDAPKAASKVVCKTRMVIDWQVLDKVTDEVVLTYKNNGNSSFRQSYYTSYANNLTSFEDAFIDFLEQSNFVELVNSEPAKPRRQLSKDTSNTEGLIISQIKNPEFTSYSEMIKHASSASVTVLTDGGHGSGVIISKQGLMLTAYHVISGVNKIEVQFNSGLVLDAEVMAFDQRSDIAILEISGSGFTALPFAKDKAQLGDEVLTIGTPADPDLGQSISKGILSGQRLIEGQKYIQSDLSISPGNSGGPLINSSGEIIGIVKSKIIGEGIEGIGFAIPIAEVIKIMNIQQ